MAFPVLSVPIPGSPTFNVDAQLFATGLADFAEEANALGSVIDLSLKSTSTTSLAIGTGSKTLTVQTGLGYVIGHPVRIASVASPANFMDGIVTAYNTLTGSLSVSVSAVGGSGTLASWNTMVLPGGGNFAGLSNNKFTGRQVLADEVTLASASTVDFTAGDSNQFLITGTTTITAVTMAQGAVIKARFSGACPITHGTNLQLQGGLSYTTNAGDILTFSSNGTVVRVEISKVNGKPIVNDVTTSSNDTNYTANGDTPISSNWALGRFGSLRHGATSFSSAYTPSAGETLSRAHSLSVIPQSARLVLKCVVADAGYSIGEQVMPNGQWNGSATAPLPTIYMDATNIGTKCATGYSVFITNKTTGAAVTPTSSAWQYAFQYTY